jgi:hypothetical protein
LRGIEPAHLAEQHELLVRERVDDAVIRLGDLVLLDDIHARLPSFGAPSPRCRAGKI